MAPGRREDKSPSARQNDVTLKMPAFEWVHVQLHQQKGMISLSPPTICNSAIFFMLSVVWKLDRLGRDLRHLINTVHDLTARGTGLKGPHHLLSFGSRGFDVLRGPAFCSLRYSPSPV